MGLGCKNKKEAPVSWTLYTWSMEEIGVGTGFGQEAFAIWRTTMLWVGQLVLEVSASRMSHTESLTLV